MKSFDLDIDGFITIHNKGKEEYYFDFDDESLDKGYVCKNDILYLFVVTDMFGGAVNVYNDEPSKIEKERIETAFKVPYEVKNGGVIIRGCDDIEEITLTNGTYEIHFYNYKEEGENFRYDLYFVKKEKPEYKVLIKQKIQGPTVVELINSKKDTLEEAVESFRYHFKLPSYYPIQKEIKFDGVTWQKFIMNDGSIQGIITKEFFNQSDSSFFKLYVRRNMPVSQKGMVETEIEGCKIFYEIDMYQPFVDNEIEKRGNGKIINFTWEEGEWNYYCSFGTANNLEYIKEMEKIYRSLKIV